MFGQGGQQTGGFGFGAKPAGGFGSTAFGRGSEVKWGSAAKPPQGAGFGQAGRSGGSVFGQPTSPNQHIPPGAAGARGVGRGAAGRGQQQSKQGRGGRGAAPAPHGTQQQQQQQARPSILSRLSSGAVGFWNKGASGSSPPNAAAAPGAGGSRAAVFGRQAGRIANARGGAHAGRGSSRGAGGDGAAAGTAGRFGAGRGRMSMQQQQPGGRFSNKTLGWQQQQQQAGRGRGSNSNRGRGRVAAGRFGNAAAIIALQQDEEMAEGDWDDAGATDCEDGWAKDAEYQDGDWPGDEVGMEDVEEHVQQKYSADEAAEDEQQQQQQQQDGPGGDYGGILSQQQLDAAKQAAIAAMPRFIGGSSGGAAGAWSGTGSQQARRAILSPHVNPPAATAAYDSLGDAPQLGAKAGRSAATFAGVTVEPHCDDMCPAAERAQRTADRQLHEFERIPGEEYATDAQHAVKKYMRSEAGGLPDPALLRTFSALRKTLSHLRTIIARAEADDANENTLLEVHRFLWDRYRALRKDITQTHLPRRGPQQMRWVIAANEEVARFLIIADAFLADKDSVNTPGNNKPASSKNNARRNTAARITFDLDQFEADAQEAADAAAAAAAGGAGGFQVDPYAGHLNHQELTKTLLDLSALYREAQAEGVSCPNEAEFTAYYIMLSCGTFGSYKGSVSNMVRLLNQVTPEVLLSPHIQYALAVSGCLEATNYVKLLRLMQGAPLPLAAVPQVFLPRLRTKALCMLLRTAPPTKDKMRQLSMTTYCNMLGFESLEQAAEFAMIHKEAGCATLGLCQTPDGDLVLEVPSAQLHTLTELPYPPRHTVSWLLDKAAGTPLVQLTTNPCFAPDLAALGTRQCAGPTAAAAARQQHQHQQQRIAPPGGKPTASLVPTPVAPAHQARGTSRSQAEFGAAQPQQEVTAAGGGNAALQVLQQAGALSPPQQQQPAPASQAWQQQHLQQDFTAQHANQWSSTGSAAEILGLGSTAGGFARGSTGRLSAVMEPSAAATNAAAVFGSLTPASLPAARVPEAVNAPQQQQQPQPQQQQQPFSSQQQLAHQQQQVYMQQQQQHLQLLHQRYHQQQQVAAAIAAEKAAASATVAATQAALAEKEAEIRRLKKSDVELRLIKQERELRHKCEDAARRLWLARWAAAAAAAKAARQQRQRQQSALAAADATLGRAGKRQLSHGAGADAYEQGIAADGDADWEHQEKRYRPFDWEAAIADFTPLPVAEILAAALVAAADSPGTSSTDGRSAPAAAQPGLHTPGVPLMLPGFADSSSSNGMLLNPFESGRVAFSRGSTIACTAADPVFKLLVVSGWRESDASIAPPLYQRRMANWLRHKLTPHLPSRISAAVAAAVSVASHHHDTPEQQQQQNGNVSIVWLAGEQQHGQQQQQHGSWVQTVANGGSVGATSQWQQHQQQAAADSVATGARSIVRLGPAAELLLARRLPVPGVKQRTLAIEVLDVASSQLVAATRHSSNDSSVVTAGTAAVLLLISGPDPQELSAAAMRLSGVLQWMPAVPAVPLVVLACSGPDTQSVIESSLGTLITTQLPANLAAKLSGGQVVCAGPGSEPEQALAAALQAAAAGAPQIPLMRHVPAPGLLQCLLALTLHTSSSSGNSGEGQWNVSQQLQQSTAAGGILSTYVSAHNAAVGWMSQLLEQHLDSDVYRWGYPPSISNISSNGSMSHGAHLAQLRLALQQLLLPEPPGLHHHQQQQHASPGSVDGLLAISDGGSGFGAAALSQLLSFLKALSGGGSCNGHSSCIAVHAGAVLAIVQQQIAVLGSSSSLAANNSCYHKQPQQQQLHDSKLLQVVQTSCQELLLLLQQELTPVGSLLLSEDLLLWLLNLHEQQRQRHLQAQAAPSPAMKVDQVNPTHPIAAQNAINGYHHMAGQRQQSGQSAGAVWQSLLQLPQAVHTVNGVTTYAADLLMVHEVATPVAAQASASAWQGAEHHNQQSMSAPIVHWHQQGNIPGVSSMLEAARAQRDAASQIAASLGIKLPDWLGG